MTNAVITGGIASFEKSRKIADYEIEKAHVTFNVGEGESAENMVQSALVLAKKYVYGALGLVDKSTAPASSTLEAPAAEAPKEPKKRAPKTPPVVPAAIPAGDLLAGPGEAPPATAPQIRTNPENRVDPLDLDPLTASPATVTDQTLTDAVTRRNASLIAAAKTAGGDGTAGTKKIKDLIAKFVVSRVSELPQGVRADFLTQLEALT